MRGEYYSIPTSIMWTMSVCAAELIEVYLRGTRVLLQCHV